MNMRLPGNPSLPGGCTKGDIDKHMGPNIGYEECLDCGGDGHLGSDCCSDDIDAYGICQKCKRHAEYVHCDACEGTGEIEFNIEERKAEEKGE